MKLTLNRFLLIFFLFTSVLPIFALSLIHINYLHKLLNHNQSFIRLIEHEELMLFYIYVAIVIVGISSCLILFRLYIFAPISNLVGKLDEIARGELPESINNNKNYLREVSQFINRFNQMIKILEDSKKQRADFIATLNHDLKTPILAEQKAFRLLKDYKLDSSNTNVIIDSLVHSNNDLVMLIDMLLDNLKYESGEIKVQKSFDLDAENLFKEYLDSLYPLFQEKSITIDLEVDPNTKLNIDRVQFKRVINNLMFNAFENSPNNTKVTIQVKDHISKTQIIIQDQGYGISVNQIDKIFERYSSTKDKPGAGLGLYVSRVIVEKHKGSIEAFTTINQGSRFEILLPK